MKWGFNEGEEEGSNVYWSMKSLFQCWILHNQKMRKSYCAFGLEKKWLMEKGNSGFVNTW